MATAVDDIVNLIANDLSGGKTRASSATLSRESTAVLANGAQTALELPLSDSLAARSIAFCYPNTPIAYPATNREVDTHLGEATLVVQNLQTTVPILNKICTTVALRRHRLVTCSLYVSNPGALAFDMHVDDWDVHIVQVTGCKRFWFGEPHSHAVELDVGTCLFIPEGMPHRADTISRSVHLSFGTHQRKNEHTITRSHGPARS